MTTKPIRVGIIGLGQIGLKHLETYRSIPGVEVVGGAGHDPERTRRAAAECDLPYWTTDFRDLLARDDIDAVSICLHNNLHRGAAVAALEAGKHVYCEKPMAGSYHDAAEMLSAAHRSGRMLSIQLSSLFAPQTRAARAAIAEGWLGKPYFAQSASARRRGRPYVDGYGTPAFVQKDLAAGGALFDTGVYAIAALLYLLENPAPLRICGRTFQETPMDPARQTASGYNVEEMGVGLVALEGGIALSILEAWAMHIGKLGGSFLAGSLGGIRLEPFELYRSLGDLDLDAQADLGAFEFRRHTVRGEEDLYDGPQQHFIAALRGRVPLLSTAEIALNTLLISEGIYLSERLGREVSASEVKEMSVSTAVI